VPSRKSWKEENVKYSSDFPSTACPTHEDGFSGQKEQKYTRAGSKEALVSLPNLELLKLANNQTFPVKGRPIKIFSASHPRTLKK
jgi:hypothetical protein